MLRTFCFLLVLVISVNVAQDLSEIEETSASSSLSSASPETSRELRSYDQDWRAVDYFSPTSDTSGWIPHQSSSDPVESSHEQQHRLGPRRILRKKKRKRPPQVLSLTNEEAGDSLSPVSEDRPRRRKRPLQQKLDSLREPWEDTSDDSFQRPVNRRRITPMYPSKESEEIMAEEKTQPNNIFEKVRDPFTALQQEEEKQRRKQEEIAVQQTTVVPDLKTLLKQTQRGSVSLSEILQQRNLSLAELLMGNQQAISALTEKSNVVEKVEPSVESSVESELSVESEPEPSIEYELAVAPVTDFVPPAATTTEAPKYKRLPPSIALRKNINRNYERSEESREELSPDEILEAQRKRMSLLNAHHKESKLYTDLTKVEVVTEPTTERRIFVPSSPKSYPSVDVKPEGEDKKYEMITQYPDHVSASITNTPHTTTAVIITTKEPTTTTKIIASTTGPRFLRPKLKGHLPMTNAKLTKLFSKSTSTMSPLSTAIKIDVNEIFGFNTQFEKANPKNEPFRMTFDLENIVQDNTPKTSKLDKVTSSPSIDTTTQEGPKSLLKQPVLGEKIKHVTAKEEIMEILNNPLEREQLSRVLKMRNMTVEQLVEQRERGSSQLHLADIFHNKTREPEPKDEPFVGQMTQDFFNNFPSLNRKQKSRSFPSAPEFAFGTTKQMTTKIQNKEPLEIVTPKPQDRYTITSFPTYKIETNKDLKKPLPFLPIWKDVYPTLFSNVHQNSHQENKIDEIKIVPSTSTSTTMSYDNFKRFEELENNLVESTHDRLDVDLFHKESNTEELIPLPSGVKSAIVASFAIIGLSIFVFLTIFVIFKWSQKRKKRLDYVGSFSGSKIRSPILESYSKPSLKTVMSETLGKKKGYYKSQLRTISDSIWDANGHKSYT